MIETAGSEAGRAGDRETSMRAAERDSWDGRDFENVATTNSSLLCWRRRVEYGGLGRLLVTL